VKVVVVVECLGVHGATTLTLVCGLRAVEVTTVCLVSFLVAQAVKAACMCLLVYCS
jgi:hypothetical protein